MGSRNEVRYTYLQLAVALTNAVREKEGADAKAYCYIDIRTLVWSWVEHPKFPSPSPNAIYKREMKKAGGGYLQFSEIASFQIYTGYNLYKYL